MRPLALTLGALLLCGAGLRAGDAARPTGLAAAPSSASAARNPYGGDVEAVRAGRKLFLRHCAECHSADARGTTSAPGLLRAVAGASPGEVFWFLTNGDRRSGMPSWSRLPEPRRWQIVAFLKTLDAGATSPRD
jgi:mono/diheme cytochrome c family protein